MASDTRGEGDENQRHGGVGGGGGGIGPVNLPTTNTTSLIGIGYLTEAMVS